MTSSSNTYPQPLRPFPYEEVNNVYVRWPSIFTKVNADLSSSGSGVVSIKYTITELESFISAAEISFAAFFDRWRRFYPPLLSLSDAEMLQLYTYTYDKTS